MASNDLGLDGIEFAEFTSPDSQALEDLFLAFGFSKKLQHKSMKIDYFNQGDIHFLVNKEKGSFAETFSQKHGPSLCSMGWRVKNAKVAFEKAIERGAKAASKCDYKNSDGSDIPAIMGIGDSLIYFIDNYGDSDRYGKLGFSPHSKPIEVDSKGFEFIDHLTNNVHSGTMTQWSDFYKNIFGFEEVRYFDIRGVKTGLTSYALRSPCGKFCIPINEASDAKSQINEYLEEYNGPGVQHIAFSTNDIVSSLAKLSNTKIETLDIDDEYYDEVFDRVPGVTEDQKELQKYNILVDGDEEGYLLQIFTKNIIGPIFIEIIQRKNHLSFGEGNFGALFRSIEKDQQKRGYLD